MPACFFNQKMKMILQSYQSHIKLSKYIARIRNDVKKQYAKDILKKFQDGKKIYDVKINIPVGLGKTAAKNVEHNIYKLLQIKRIKIMKPSYHAPVAHKNKIEKVLDTGRKV